MYTHGERERERDSVICVISGLRHEAVENCALLGHYAAVVVIPYRRFGTTYRSYYQGSRIKKLGS